MRAARRGAWQAAIDVLGSSEQVTQGDVTTIIVHASGAYAFELVGKPPWSWELLPRVGAGRAFMTATAAASASSADAQDLYADLALGTGFSYEVSRLRFGIAAELGYADGPIGYADSTEVTRTSGVFASLLLDARLGL